MALRPERTDAHHAVAAAAVVAERRLAAPCHGAPNDDDRLYSMVHLSPSVPTCPANLPNVMLRQSPSRVPDLSVAAEAGARFRLAEHWSLLGHYAANDALHNPGNPMNANHRIALLLPALLKSGVVLPARRCAQCSLPSSGSKSDREGPPTRKSQESPSCRNYQEALMHAMRDQRFIV